MLLVADSGSTKCDWILVKSNGERLETNTMGFNPFFHNEELIASEISKNEILMSHADKILNIYFFGAGASSKQRNTIVENGLKKVFKNTVELRVDHDLIGAAIATAEDDPGIACILGTGSNSCYYDGITVHEVVPALGYILGDEGSGAYFGKILLSKYLYKKLPIELATALENEYGVTKESIFEAVYNKPNPNVYLASFMRFARDHNDHPFFKEMIYKGISGFINIHVWCYENFREVPVHFVGSIAYYFKDTLEEVAKNYRFTIGKIVKKPVTPLADYYCKKLNFPIV
jgi:N-acetylglucosamine kinase-like BadF-type ATPase